MTTPSELSKYSKVWVRGCLIVIEIVGKGERIIIIRSALFTMRLACKLVAKLGRGEEGTETGLFWGQLLQVGYGWKRFRSFLNSSSSMLLVDVQITPTAVFQIANGNRKKSWVHALFLFIVGLGMDLRKNAGLNCSLYDLLRHVTFRACKTM